MQLRRAEKLRSQSQVKRHARISRAVRAWIPLPPAIQNMVFPWDFAKPEWYLFEAGFVQRIFRRWRRSKSLSQPVLSLINHLLRDLLTELNGVDGIVFSEPAQDGHLCAQHIAAPERRPHLR